MKNEGFRGKINKRIKRKRRFEVGRRNEFDGMKKKGRKKVGWGRKWEKRE